MEGSQHDHSRSVDREEQAAPLEKLTLEVSGATGVVNINGSYDTTGELMNGSVAYKRKRRGHDVLLATHAADDMWCCRDPSGIWWFTDPEYRGQGQGWARSTDSTATPWEATGWMEYHAGGGWRNSGNSSGGGMKVVPTGGVWMTVKFVEVFHQVHEAPLDEGKHEAMEVVSSQSSSSSSRSREGEARQEVIHEPAAVHVIKEWARGGAEGEGGESADREGGESAGDEVSWKRGSAMALGLPWVQPGSAPAVGQRQPHRLFGPL